MNPPINPGMPGDSSFLMRSIHSQSSRVKGSFLPQNPLQFQEFLSAVLCSHARFEEISTLIIEQLEINCPTETANLKKLISRYPHMVNELKALRWMGLKNKYQDEMKQVKENGMSYEQLRKVIVNATINLSLAAIKKMGYPEPGFHASFGTPGWSSDLDTTYFPGQEVPQEVQALEKLLFDAIIFGNFKALPSQLLDTASYIGQYGEYFAIEDQLKSHEAKQNYSLLELSLAMTHIHKGNFECSISSEVRFQENWESFKSEQLRNAEFYSIDYKNNLNEILSDIENFKKEMAFQIDELAVHLYLPNNLLPCKNSQGYESIIHKLALQIKKLWPESYQNADMSYRSSVLIGLSIAMDLNLKLIDRLKSQLKNVYEHLQQLMKIKKVSKTSLSKINEPISLIYRSKKLSG